MIWLFNLLEKPTNGRLLLGTDDITDARGEQLRGIRRDIGMIFQHFNLLGSKTIAENIAFPLRIARGHSSTPTRTRVDELLQRVGLADMARTYPAQLSGTVDWGEKWQIVCGTLLPKVLPGICVAITVTLIALASNAAMSSVIGGAGLGGLAIRFGYQRFPPDVMTVTVVLLLILVQTLQWAGDRLIIGFTRK